MSFELRPYQRDAIASCFNTWEGAGGEPAQQRIAIQLPTGAGKTVVFTKLIRQAREERGFGTTLIFAHRDELVQQAVDKLISDDPTLRVGVVKAERNEVDNVDVIVASIQTLHRKARLASLPPIELVIIDEAHHASANTYIKVLKAIGCFTPGGPWLLGVSATLERTDGKLLRDVFESIPFQMDILDLIPDFLVEPRAKKIDVQEFDLTAVKTVAGDLVSEDLAKALEKSGAYGVVAAAYREQCPDRPGIVFCPNIATSVKMAEVLCDWGFKAEVITSKTNRDERRDIIERYQKGDTQILANCGVLTEGFDAPHTSAIVLARPTKSRVLFSQMVGRGLRPYPGKEDCLIMDLVGVAGRHQLCTVADLTKHDIHPVRDGETLGAAKKRTVAEVAEEEARKARGTLKAKDIDLLRRTTGSSIRDGWWLLSAGGHPFIKVTAEDDSESVFWIEEIPGYRHVLMWAPADGQPECLLSGVDYGAAARTGVEEAAYLTKAQAFVNPSARWRRQPFSDCKQGQINYAARLGIDMEDEPSKGDLSDRITVCTIGARVDAWISTNRR